MMIPFVNKYIFYFFLSNSVFLILTFYPFVLFRMFCTILSRSIEKLHLDIFTFFSILSISIQSLSILLFQDQDHHSYRAHGCGDGKHKIPYELLGVMACGAIYLLETEHLLIVSDLINTLISVFGTIYLQSVSSKLMI